MILEFRKVAIEQKQFRGELKTDPLSLIAISRIKDKFGPIDLAKSFKNNVREDCGHHQTL